jgi:hypothetical protein
LAEHGERIVCDEDFADCYSDGRRAALDPALAGGQGVLLLQYAAVFPTSRRWRRWPGICVGRSRSVCRSTTRLESEHADALSRPPDAECKERVALENTLALAGELGLLDAPVEPIVDSTPMLGAAATQDTVRLVRSGVKKLIDAVAATDAEAARALDDGLCFDYSRPVEKPDCRWREKQERERMLTWVAEDAERALRAVEGAPGLLDEDQVEDTHALLRELIGQDFDVAHLGVDASTRCRAALP